VAAKVIVRYRCLPQAGRTERARKLMTRSAIAANATKWTSRAAVSAEHRRALAPHNLHRRGTPLVLDPKVLKAVRVKRQRRHCRLNTIDARSDTINDGEKERNHPPALVVIVPHHFVH
jgi:hypothetical protein